MDINYAEIATSAGFKEHFWAGQNSNAIVNFLNDGRTGNNDTLRKENLKPRIYFIVMNTNRKVVVQTEEWKLVKVGFTHCDARENADNRMDDVITKIRQRKPNSNPAVLFKPAIKAIDTDGTYFAIEKRVRRYFGIEVEPNLLKGHLPIHTEWVLTTQAHINRVNEAKIRRQGNAAGGHRNDYDTDITRDNRFERPQGINPEDIVREILVAANQNSSEPHC